MSPDQRDDDPTRALDDFVRRMRPGAAPAAAPDLSDLGDKLQPERAGSPKRPKGGMLRNGQRWDADDVEDVPVVEVPHVAAPRRDMPQVRLPAVDLGAEAAQLARSPDINLPPVHSTPADVAALDQATLGASRFAASQWGSDGLASGEPDWQPDVRKLHQRHADSPRLLAAWQAGAWVGAVREVFDTATEFINTRNGLAVEAFAPHRLMLLWPPQAPSGPMLLGRWPQLAWLSAVAADQASEALLAQVPGDAPLWINPVQKDVDWALAADIVLHHDTTLRPFQLDGLRAFSDAEREANYARLNADFHRPVAGAPVQRR